MTPKRNSPRLQYNPLPLLGDSSFPNAIVSVIAFHLHKPLGSFDGSLACGFNWAEGARQEFPHCKKAGCVGLHAGNLSGIVLIGRGMPFVAIAGKLLSDCINKGCCKAEM